MSPGNYTEEGERRLMALVQSLDAEAQALRVRVKELEDGLEWARRLVDRIGFRHCGGDDCPMCIPLAGNKGGEP